MSDILIIDDEKMICDILSRQVERMGHSATSAYNLAEGIRCAGVIDFDVIFLDVRLPDGNGLAALPTLKSSPSPPEIIIITGKGDPDGAEIAVKTGAWDYIEKPLSLKEITLQLTRALKYREEKLSQNAAILVRLEGIVGNAPSLTTCLELVAQSANTDTDVLITGETGTGKELFARAIHDNSHRAGGNFVVVDCASLPENLVESVLFGHAKGAFTGADEQKFGLIREADGGTLFLDEVGELPVGIQKTFLRVLQERRFRPVGSKEELASNFRLIAATHRNLEEMCHQQRFREDLLFRIRTIEINLPPLRERVEDIEKLILHFISKLCRRYGVGTKGVSPEFILAAKNYDWPGNVRELANAVDGALCQAQNQSMLYPAHLPTHVRVKLARSSIKSTARQDTVPAADKLDEVFIPSLKTLIEATEKEYLQNLINITLGDIRKACEISGLSRTRLYVRLKKFDISRPT